MSKPITALFTLVVVSVSLVPGVIAAVDPTKPFSITAAPLAVRHVHMQGASMQLQSIIERNGQSKAIINGKLVEEDGTIGDYQLVAINKDNVMLKSAERQVELSLFRNVKNNLQIKKL